MCSEHSQDIGKTEHAAMIRNTNSSLIHLARTQEPINFHINKAQIISTYLHQSPSILLQTPKHISTPCIMHLSTLLLLHLPASVLAVTYCARPKVSMHSTGAQTSQVGEHKEQQWREACFKSGLTIRRAFLDDYLSDIQARGAKAEPPTFAVPSSLVARDLYDVYFDALEARDAHAEAESEPEADALPNKKKPDLKQQVQQGLRSKHHHARDLSDAYLDLLEARDAEAEAEALPKKNKIDLKQLYQEAARSRHRVRDADADADASPEAEAEALAGDLFPLDAILEARALNGASAPFGSRKTSVVTAVKKTSCGSYSLI